MQTLQDCRYTAFVSYAHADDAAWFHWVTQFRNELERSLGALLRGVKLPRFHLSGENGPVAGLLGDELKQRIDESFAMVIVVHDNYAQSDWCLKELEYFAARFGQQGFRERLYIVAMSEAAITTVTQHPTWRRLMPHGEQLWIPFYEPGDTTRPLDIYLAPGLVAPAFRQPFERLRSDFAAKLRRALQAPPATRPLPDDDAAPPAGPGAVDPYSTVPLAGPAPTPASGGGSTVLLGFGPPPSAGAAQAAAQLLVQRGVAARVLAQDIVFSDFADFAAATRLVLAVDDAPLMMTTLAAGGHLELQRDAWARQGRPADALLWLDLRADPHAPPPPGSGAAWAASLGIAMLTPGQLADRLAAPPRAPPPPAPSFVRIYIESNRHERTLWEPLGEQIRARWDALTQQLAPQRVPPLSLRARGLPVDQIDAFPTLDDADGVVLLWGRKTSEALVAQINKVENKMAPGRDAAPGIVAYLMPPQQASEPVPAWGWQVLRFRAEDEHAIQVVDEEGDELTRFLRKVFERRAQRDRLEEAQQRRATSAGAAAPGAGGQGQGAGVAGSASAAATGGTPPAAHRTAPGVTG
jgi:hypothetical protein